MTARDRFEELLDLYLDEELSAAERAEWDALLAANPELDEEAREERELVQMMRSAPKVQAPAGLLAGAMKRARIEREGKGEGEGEGEGDSVVTIETVERRATSRSVWVRLAQVAAVFVVIGGSWVAWQTSQEATELDAPRSMSPPPISDSAKRMESAPSQDFEARSQLMEIAEVEDESDEYSAFDAPEEAAEEVKGESLLRQTQPTGDFESAEGFAAETVAPAGPSDDVMKDLGEKEEQLGRVMRDEDTAATIGEEMPRNQAVEAAPEPQKSRQESPAPRTDTRELRPPAPPTEMQPSRRSNELAQQPKSQAAESVPGTRSFADEGAAGSGGGATARERSARLAEEEVFSQERVLEIVERSGARKLLDTPWRETARVELRGEGTPRAEDAQDGVRFLVVETDRTDSLPASVERARVATGAQHVLLPYRLEKRRGPMMLGGASDAAADVAARELRQFFESRDGRVLWTTDYAEGLDFQKRIGPAPAAPAEDGFFVFEFRRPSSAEDAVDAFRRSGIVNYSNVKQDELEVVYNVTSQTRVVIPFRL